MKNTCSFKDFMRGAIFVVEIILLIVIICKGYPRTDPNLGFDYLGLMVTTLGALAAALVAWQIYNVISVDRIIKDSIDREKKQLKDELTNELALVKTELQDAIYASVVQQSNNIAENYIVSAVLKKGTDQKLDYLVAFDSLCSSFIFLSKVKDRSKTIELQKDAHDMFLKKINEIVFLETLTDEIVSDLKAALTELKEYDLLALFMQKYTEAKSGK